MKPNFALDFRDETVALLFRTPRGWREVGEVAMDGDMAQGLDDLRAIALELSPEGITTKLIIPNSQILYTDLVAPGPDDADRRAQIRDGLDGRTPYAADDLVFDWSGAGEDVQVAVIARETLEEAESFAMQHRMNPVGFAAIPPEGAFAGEPWFGTSGMASAFLHGGDRVERDLAPVVVVDRGLPLVVPGAADMDAIAAQGDPLPQSAPDELPPAEPEGIPPRPDLPPDPAPQEDPGPAPDPVPLPPQDPPPPVPPEPGPTPAFDPEPLDLPGPDLPETDLLAPAPLAEEFEAAPALSISGPDAARPPFAPQPRQPADEAPMAIDVPVEDEAPTAPESVAGAPAEDDLPPMPSTAMLSAFASRRAGGTTVPPLTAPAKAPPPVGPAARPQAPRPAAKVPDLPPLRPKAAPARTAASAGVTAQTIPGTKKRKAPAPQPATPTPRPPVTPQAAAAAATMAPGTTFKTRDLPVRGKPRYLGLILTIALVVIIAVAAAVSSFITSSKNETQPADTTVVSGEGAAPSEQDEMAADLQDPADFPAEGQDADAASDLPPDTATVETAPAEATPAEATTEATAAEIAAAQPAPEPAPTTDAAASSAPAAPASDAPQDEIFLATADTPPATTDPQALTTPPAGTDAAPATGAAPPPFGTVYKFDAEGRIVPTPQGIVTPDGVTLIAGRPKVLPPERPASVTAAAAVATAPVVAQPAAALPAAEAAPLPPADPALAGARPKARPEGLAPAQDDAAAPVVNDASTASLRPQGRTAAVVAAGDAARKAAAAASTANPEVTLASAQLPPGALAISSRPAPRPRDLSRAVEAAVAAAVRAAEPEAQPQPQVVATAQPKAQPQPEPAARTEAEADDEPEVASAAPKIPVKASVAKQATFANAINLSKTNLIGVYGSASNRYALVRQSNGRYSKVKVGDTLDGGRVAAITTSEVRYQKGSRMLSLTLPEG
ncbi:MAG: translation initiation factor 2 [Paracoccaceae bacterium]